MLDGVVRVAVSKEEGQELIMSVDESRMWRGMMMRKGKRNKVNRREV